MGQKVHPYILRIGFGKEWLSRWFTDKKREYADFLAEDIKIREIIKNNYPQYIAIQNKNRTNNQKEDKLSCRNGNFKIA